MNAPEAPAWTKWVERAEEDFLACHKLGADVDAFAHTIVYHAQQAAEKYVKAIFVQLGKEPPRIHNLLRLAELLAPMGCSLAAVMADLQELNPFAVAPRYPGEEADAGRARNAMGSAGRVRQHCRHLLGLVGATPEV